MADGRSAPATIGALLRAAAARLDTAGSDTPRLDAEVLLGHVLKVDRATLLAAPEAVVSSAQTAAYDALLEQRELGRPVAYLRGLKEFYGLALSVDERALIPRPETETIVELALDRLGALLGAAARPAGTPAILIWDVGTGSGAIAIAIAVESRRRRYAGDIRLLATDVAADALALALENAVAHGVADTIEFGQADLATLPDIPAVDLLLANLPYIPSAVVPTLPPAAQFEPLQALDGGPDGLQLIGRLLRQLPGILAADGRALLEIGADQADALQTLVTERLPGWSLTVHADLADRPRVAEIGRAGPPE